MSRAYQAERAMEREQNALDQDFADDRITLEEYRRATRELERDLRACYEEDQEEALRAVREDWGW